MWGVALGLVVRISGRVLAEHPARHARVGQRRIAASFVVFVANKTVLGSKPFVLKPCVRAQRRQRRRHRRGLRHGIRRRAVVRHIQRLALGPIRVPPVALVLPDEPRALLLAAASVRQPDGAERAARGSEYII